MAEYEYHSQIYSLLYVPFHVKIVNVRWMRLQVIETHLGENWSGGCPDKYAALSSRRGWIRFGISSNHRAYVFSASAEGVMRRVFFAILPGCKVITSGPGFPDSGSASMAISISAFSPGAWSGTSSHSDWDADSGLFMGEELDWPDWSAVRIPRSSCKRFLFLDPDTIVRALPEDFPERFVGEALCSILICRPYNREGLSLDMISYLYRRVIGTAHR